jgi:hypothetical protein
MNRRGNLLRRSAIAGTLLGLSLPTVSAAQAWTGDRGSTSFFLSYGNNWSTKHYTFDGVETDGGHVRSQVATFGISYVLTDRLTLTASLPVVQAKYMGSRPHPGSNVDNGDYHTGLQDVRFELRYQVSENPLAFTPFLASGWPTTDYVTLGHSARGRGLDQYVAGFYVGSSLDEWIPDTYAQMRYGYAYVESVAGIHPNHSNLDAEVGHFLTPVLGLRVLASWQETHGGVDTVGKMKGTDSLFPHHDQVGDESYINVGLGFSYSITHKVDVSAIYARSLRGRNGHKLDDGLGLGVSFSCHCAFRQVGERIYPISPRNR